MKSPPNFYYYKTLEGDIIKVSAYFRPSLKKKPPSCTWKIAKEQDEDGNWVTPCFAEITWSTLKNFEYLGKNIEIK